MGEFTAEIIKIIDETHDVKTFRLKRPKELDFIPGQYCIVSFADNINLDGESIPLTFSSSPAQKDYFDLTVKKMHEFTAELFNLKASDKLRIDGPRGETLNFDESIKDGIVYLAGGSGITPFMSHIRYNAEKKLPNKMILLFSNKTREDIIFREELNRIAYSNKNIKVINTITTDTCSGDADEHGMISKEMTEKYVKEPEKYLFYICGPPPMVDSMKEILKAMKISEEKIKFENWQIAGKGD